MKKKKNYICNGEFKDSPYVIYREVLLDNNVPAAFIDIYHFNKKDPAVIVLATNELYRNKGYASRLLKRAIVWSKKPKFLWNMKLRKVIIRVLG